MSQLHELTITIDKTMDGQSFVQIMSPAAVPVNIVLIASTVTVEDRRDTGDSNDPS